MKNITKHIVIFLIVNCSIFINTYGQVGINNTNSSPDNSAMLDVSSTDKGVLIPRMTTAQRDAITSPAKGLMIFNSETNQFNYHNGAVWTIIGADNLGNHTATQNLQLNNQWMSNDGDNEGVKIDSNYTCELAQIRRLIHVDIVVILCRKTRFLAYRKEPSI